MGEVIGAEEAALLPGGSYADYPLTEADWGVIKTAHVAQMVGSGDTQWAASYCDDRPIVIPNG